MKEVTVDQFYAAIRDLDVISSVVGDFPYTTEFKTRSGGVMKGKVIDRYGEGDEDHVVSAFYIC